MRPTKRPGLLVKIGGVLIDRHVKWDNRHIERVPPRAGFENLRHLSKHYDINVVSSANYEAQKRVWLERFKVLNRAGLNPENLHFYRDEKDLAFICKNLEVTDAVVSKPGKIMRIKEIQTCYLLAPSEDVLEEFASTKKRIHVVLSWHMLAQRLVPHPPDLRIFAAS